MEHVYTSQREALFVGGFFLETRPPTVFRLSPISGDAGSVSLFFDGLI